MNRQNFLHDQPWDEHLDEYGITSRVFWRPEGALMGASLHELEPGGPGFTLHMHYGAEELFFVVSGTPTLRTAKTEEVLSPGDFVFCPDGRRGLHAFTNPCDEPARILAISAGGFPDVVAYPEQGYAWVATRDPHLEEPDPEDPGLIVRFEIPKE